MVESLLALSPRPLRARPRPAAITTRPGPTFRRRSCRNERSTKPTTRPAKAGSRAPMASRFPDPEPAARGLFGRQRRAGIGAAIGDMISTSRLSSTALLDEHGAWRSSLTRLNAWFAHGRKPSRLRKRLSELLSSDRSATTAEPHLVGQSAADAPALRDRRLHRFLCRHSPRDQRRQAVPARQSAAAQL